MRKLILILVVTIMIFITSGCVEENKVSYSDKIIGSWISAVSMNQSENAIFNFYSNGSVSLVIHLNESIGEPTTIVKWFNYTMNGKLLTMDIMGEKEVLECRFSDDYNKLTLIEQDSGGETVLVRLRNKDGEE